MGPNWLAYLVRALSAVPYIVAGIEHIHGDAKAGADKKVLAMEALGLSAAIAPAVDPAHAATITAASQLASNTIDGVVAVMNAAKEKPQPLKLPVSAPAPAPAPVVAVSIPAPAVAAPTAAAPGGTAADSVWP